MKSSSLRSLPLKRTYSSLETDLAREVVAPLLQRSVRYNRGVGFFTSGWLKKTSQGILHFVKNQGKAQLILSPNLEEKDWRTIEAAANQDAAAVQIALTQLIYKLEATLENDTLVALAWLIRDKVFDFRFAIPLEKLTGGIFHSKIAIFFDKFGDGVAIHGSQNDSSQASLNEESLSVFCSWDEGEAWFLEHQRRFEQMWNKGFTNLKILTISEADKEILIRPTRNFPRPYPTDKPEETIRAKPATSQLHLPAHIELRDYQKSAIHNWEQNGRKGIFEMATGTGKTITAISAAVKLFQAEKKLATVVLVPYKHLVDQWVEELRGFGFQPIACYESVKKWKPLAATKIREFNAGLRDHLCLVSTHQTASSEEFRKLIRMRLQASFLLLGDEIHELGAPHLRKGLLETASWRIGLSATPDRWYDESGTEVLRNYFGETIIQYELKEAIKQNALTPYDYYPETISLTSSEIEEYNRLSILVAQLIGMKDKNNARLEQVLRKRADLLGRAHNKKVHLLELLNRHKAESLRSGRKFQHILIYCNKGTHKEILSEVSELGIKCHEFVYDVSLKRRREVLRAFSQGEIDALIAIKCLDQGVDVPATKRAYILASSTNPREFVQRRGRVLRKSDDKIAAEIFDFIVGPWEIGQYSNQLAKSLLLRELPRFAEFSQDARNTQEAREIIWDAVQQAGLIPAMHKNSWEVYRESTTGEKD